MASVVEVSYKFLGWLYACDELQLLGPESFPAGMPALNELNPLSPRAACQQVCAYR